MLWDNNKSAKRTQNFSSTIHLFLFDILIFTISAVSVLRMFRIFFQFELLLLATHWYLLFFFFSFLVIPACCVYTLFFSPVFCYVCFFSILHSHVRTHTLPCLSTKKISHLPAAAALRVKRLPIGLCQCYSLLSQSVSLCRHFYLCSFCCF